MKPKELFHYTKVETAVKNILPDKNLKLSQLQFTNDPKETKELVFISFLGVAPVSWPRAKTQQIAKNIKLQEWKVLCFSQNDPAIERNDVTALDNPFLKGKFRPAMWAHYASSPDCPHDGVCLIFNYKKLNNRIIETFKNKDKYSIFSGAVQYDDKKLFIPPPLNWDGIVNAKDSEIETQIRNYFFQNYKEIFLTKANDWQNENEFRWLIHSESDSPEYVSIDGILEGVIVGQEFAKEYEGNLIAICESLRIFAKRMWWVNGIPDEKIIYNHK